MSQELSDKIRAAAQAKGIDPEVALRIAGAESTYNPKAQSKTSSAGGLFQVVDKTWKDFGGAPGKKMDPVENIRVGTDIIAKNTESLKGFLNRDPRPAEVYAAHYFGATGAKGVLSADPNTPAIDVLGARVIRDNPNLKGKTTGQVMAQLEKKMGGTAVAAPVVSREPIPEQTPAEQMMEPALRSGMTAQAPATPEVPAAAERTASLGPSYQAALALSFLSDTDDKEDRDIDREPGIAEKWLAEQPEKQTTLAGFSDISIKSPFAEPAQPQMLADGGEVGEPAPVREPGQVTGINKFLDFVAQRLPAEKFPTAGRVFLESVQGKQEPITESHFSPQELDTIREMVNLKGGESGAISYQDYGKLGKEMRKRGELPTSLSPSLFSMSDPLGNVQTTLGRFKYSRDPSGNLQVTDSYDFNPPNEMATQEARTGDYGALGPYGLIRDYAGEKLPPGKGRKVQINLGMPVKRAGGGEAEPTPEELEAASRPATVNPMIQRQGEAARRLAAMRDVNTLPDPRTYAAVSGFMGIAPDEMGFSAMHQDLPGIKKAGEAGFYAGTAAQVAPLVGPAAKMLGKFAGSALNERILAGKPPVPGLGMPSPLAFAVKPRGGVSAYTGQTPGISDVDHVILNYTKAAEQLRAPDEVQEFLRAKAPKYFASNYGTADDPLRTALRERRIEPFGRDQPKLPPYLIDTAGQPEARGYLQAKTDLERVYDEMTGIRPFALKPEGVTNMGSEASIRKMLSEKMGEEGVPIEARNVPSVNSYSQEDFAKYPSSSRMLSQFVENQEKLPSSIQHALKTGEPIFDVNPNMEMLSPLNVVQALQEVPANKLKNMSFPEALIQGAKALAPIRDYRTAIDLADRGASVPRKALDLYTRPVVDAPSVGGQWVQLTKPVATELEGKLMKHSIGGYGAGDYYGTAYTQLPYGGKKAFDDGLVRVYSLRDKQGLPEVSVEMAKSSAGKGDTWNVSQIRGRFNSEPSLETHGDIFNLLSKIDKTDGLNDVKANSYTRSATGDTVEGSAVDWGREYRLWKQSAE
jgi:hypothetical protein